jgi:hypothetical protein
VKPTLRRRFYLEAALAIASGALFVITLLWHDWIEIVFDVDPDRGNGSLEWMIAIGLFALAAGCAFGAGRELRRPSRIAG